MELNLLDLKEQTAIFKGSIKILSFTKQYANIFFSCIFSLTSPVFYELQFATVTQPSDCNISVVVAGIQQHVLLKHLMTTWKDSHWIFSRWQPVLWSSFTSPIRGMESQKCVALTIITVILALLD